MQRRHFLQTGILGTASAMASLSGLGLAADTPAEVDSKATSSRKFTLRYAPHFGMFRHSAGGDLIAQLEFAADQGFSAWEDNEMKDRPVDVQQSIAAVMEKRGMEMGVISALRGVWNQVNFAGTDQGRRDEVLAAMKKIIDVAKRVRARYLTVVPGLVDPKLPSGYQFANCIDLLRRCCDVIEPEGLVMVLEPLNLQKDHPGVYLSEGSQAFALCRAVNRPSCKILFDLYHQQITTGNLISHVDRCWSEIAYLQSGDNPGRNEPGTGEINYANVFQHVLRKGYQGIVGMEHGNSRKGIEGEQAVIAAYRAVDPAPTRTAAETK